MLEGLAVRLNGAAVSFAAVPEFWYGREEVRRREKGPCAGPGTIAYK
jgi:hypothetical protein